MATTTNYGWTTPDDTDLVKDGAAAIRTLGSSVDTTVKNLSPGTTAGDLDYYTSGTAKARLGIGTAGQLLTVNSGATAPEWTTISAGGGQTLLSTTTLSGTSTTISAINQTYNQLIVVITQISLSSTSSAYPAIKINGVSLGNSVIRQISTTATTAAQGGNNSNIDLHYNLWNSSNQNNSWIFTITDYASTANYKPWTYTGQYQTSASAVETINGGGNILNNAAVTSLEFITGGPTFNAGTVRIYGVK